MSFKLVLATRNRDKIIEVEKILNGLPIELLTLKALPAMPEVVEDGNTLEANAVKKAKEIAQFTGLAAVADDTGLEVDYLNGAPGVYSSRYAGEKATYSENVSKIVNQLEGVSWEQRSAKFRTVVAFYEKEHVETMDGRCDGFITEAPRGTGHFGYDPLFYVPQYNMTFAEMDLEMKNKISHRGIAFKKFRDFLVERKLNIGA